MQFVYDKFTSQELLVIRDENYRYLFRAKRLKVGDSVEFRNLVDDILYHYLIEDIGKKEATLRLQDTTKPKKADLKTFHLIWCIIDPKIIYSTLPMLNQIGVSKISFVYCDRSQKNFKIDFEKCKKILINSCQQCGRTNLMEIEILDNLDDVLKKYHDFAVLDFGGDTSSQEISACLIGCEGGFSENEREKLQNNYKIGFQTSSILKSETAAVIISSKLLI